MRRPILFSYATGELSQDAFLCWLLAWASLEYESTDQKLHLCARKLIGTFFAKHKKTAPDTFTDITIERQKNHIDVLCVIDNTHVIIIEDKIGTEDHSGQLQRYKKQVAQRLFNGEKIPPENILAIYFQTGDQSDYSHVKDAGYKPFLRQDFLRVLHDYLGANAILVDYRTWLLSVSKKIKNYHQEPISCWDTSAWTGFYSALQQKLKGSHWRYVANPRGGFMGFWWAFQGDGDCQPYLQLEEDRLCCKISVAVTGTKERAALRTKWHRLVMEKASDSGLDLKKPPRFGNSAHMTVGVLKEDYRIHLDGLLDMEQTIAVLKKAEKLLVSTYESSSEFHLCG